MNVFPLLKLGSDEDFSTGDYVFYYGEGSGYISQELFSPSPARATIGPFSDCQHENLVWVLGVQSFKVLGPLFNCKFSQLVYTQTLAIWQDYHLSVPTSS